MWLNGLVVSALGIRTRVPGFDSQVMPLFHWVATLGKLMVKVVCSSLCKTYDRAAELPVIWGHTLLPATRHRWMHPITLTSTRQAGTRFIYPGGWKAELTLVVGYIPRWFTCPQTVTHQSSSHLIATRQGVELTTIYDRKVQRPNLNAINHPKDDSFGWCYVTKAKSTAMEYFICWQNTIKDDIYCLS